MGFNPNMVACEPRYQQRRRAGPCWPRSSPKRSSARSLCIVIAGNSARDFEYKKAVLDLIIKETKATSLKAVEEGDVHNAYVWRFIRVTSSIRETMRATGVFGGEVFGTDSYLVQSNFIQHSREDKKDSHRADGYFPTTSIPSLPLSSRGSSPTRRSSCAGRPPRMSLPAPMGHDMMRATGLLMLRTIHGP